MNLRGTRVGSGWVSRNHQAGASGVSQVGTDSDLFLVMSLWLLSKVSATPRPAVAHLGPTEPQELFKKYCRGWLPTIEKYFLRCFVGLLIASKEPPAESVE